MKKLKTCTLIPNLKNWETEASLKQFLKKTDLKWKLTSHASKKVKSISSHFRKFQLTIFFSQTTMVTNIFHKLVAPLYNYFKFYVPVNVSIYPEIALNQLKH